MHRNTLNLFAVFQIYSNYSNIKAKGDYFIKSLSPSSDRVATHSGNSGKPREFSSWRKSQGDSENFDFFLKIQGRFKILKISRYFFAIFKMRFINLVQEINFIYFKVVI